MRHIKPGRGPSALSAIAGIVGVIFGVFWTVIAYRLTRNAPWPFAIFFPLFGVLFIVVGLINVGYNIYNATQKKRLSVFDVTSTAEESDPLNDLLSGRTFSGSDSETVETRLRELDELLKKGLVTDAEYAAQRQRILNTL